MFLENILKKLISMRNSREYIFSPKGSIYLYIENKNNFFSIVSMIIQNIL